MIGNAEIALVLSVAGPILVGVLAYFAKDFHGDSKEHGKKITEQDRRLAVLEASSVAPRVEEHGLRLTAIEIGLGEIKGDLRYVKRWVEAQSDQSRHRRRDDDDKGD